MAHIIPLRGDPHERTQSLLPWYGNGTLDLAETAMVEAHLAECAECRNERAEDRALRRQVATLAVDVDRGWAAMCERIEARPRRRIPPFPRMLRRPVTLGWAVAAQLAAAAVLVAAMPVLRSEPRDQVYHALGAAPATAAGNVIVLFRPDARVQDLRAVLDGAGARLVDGPNASGAYLLHVSDATRGAALARLRAAPDVVLAEPIDRAP